MYNFWKKNKDVSTLLSLSLSLSLSAFLSLSIQAWLLSTDSVSPNINEILPKELYNLKTLVYKKSKDKNNNFIAYMRDGCIFARMKKEYLSNTFGRWFEQFFRRTQQVSSVRIASALSTAVEESEPPSDDALSTNVLSYQATTIGTEKNLRVSFQCKFYPSTHWISSSFLGQASKLSHNSIISETKLGPIVEDSIIALKRYTLLRQDRRVNGGGVALFVHNSLTVTQLCSSTGKWSRKPGVPEYLFCEVKPKHLPLIFVGVVYHPPHAPFLAGEDKNFLSDLVNHMHSYNSKVILGDFNADILSSTADAAFVKSIIAENSLTSIAFGATYHRDNSDSALSHAVSRTIHATSCSIVWRLILHLSAPKGTFFLQTLACNIVQATSTSIWCR